MIQLQPVIYKEQKEMVKAIIENYHSYVPSNRSVGRRIDWLVYNDQTIVGMIGIGSSVYPPPKDILRHTNLTKEEYRSVFNSFANNWRFCMMEKIENAGTQILKQLRQQAPILWKRKYEDDLKYIITFVAGGNNGAVYKADNWKLIGETSGLPEHKSVSMKWDEHDTLAKRFVKPTGENRKLIFLKEL
jgi:hypothetical protein